MIVGHGDIAGAIIDRPDRLYFASGVSNSGETRESEYTREYALLLNQPRAAHLVYFSSLSVIFEQDTRYTRHKRWMETSVRANFPLHAIVRIGNIDWGTNPHTIINHLRARHALGLALDIQDVYRYVTDRANLQGWLDRIPDTHSVEFNIYGRRLKVAQIVREYVIWGEGVTA
jgi:hypothetical protein